MKLQSKIEILEESVNEIKEFSSQIEDTIEDNSFDENDKKNEITWNLDEIFKSLDFSKMGVSLITQEILKSEINKENYAPILEFVQNAHTKLEEEIENLKDSFSSVYNFSPYYSSIENSKIGINVKLYGQKNPNLDSIKEKLIKKGYEKEDVDENIDAELLENYISRYNEDSWSSFEDSESKGFDFIGSDGRMDGYAIFRVKTDNPDDFNAFSDEIESLHKEVLNGLDEEDIIERIIDDCIIFTKDEKIENQKKEDYEKNRAYTLTTTPTNKFALTCSDMRVKFWDGDIGYIRGANVNFQSDNLTLGTILDNLKDDYFGVQEILGGDYIEVSQMLLIEKIYLDNNETIKYMEENEVFCGELSKKDSNLNDLVKVQEKPITEKFEPNHLNKIVSDFETNSINNKCESEDVSSQDATSKTKKPNKQR